MSERKVKITRMEGKIAVAMKTKKDWLRLKSILEPYGFSGSILKPKLWDYLKDKTFVNIDFDKWETGFSKKEFYHYDDYKCMSFDAFLKLQKIQPVFESQVKKPKVSWTPKVGDRVWIVGSSRTVGLSLVAQKAEWKPNIGLVAVLRDGSCFRTRELAREAIRSMKKTLSKVKKA